jgi:hypothetical protein
MTKPLPIPGLVEVINPKESLQEPQVLANFPKINSREVRELQVTTQGPVQCMTTTPPAYSTFSTRRKKWTVWLMALASWFSPASGFIYFPAIHALADSLGVSIGKINVTVTSYLVVSAVAPAIVGSAADEAGRRPVLVISLLIYIIANIGLAVQRSYVALLLLRMLQSAGISGRSLYLSNDYLV